MEILEFLAKVLKSDGASGVLALAAASALVMAARALSKQQPEALRKRLEKAIGTVRIDLVRDLASVRSELHEAVRHVREELAEEVGALRDDLRNKASREMADDRARMVREQLDMLARQLTSIETRLEHLIERGK